MNTPRPHAAESHQPIVFRHGRSILGSSSRAPGPAREDLPLSRRLVVRLEAARTSISSPLASMSCSVRWPWQSEPVSGYAGGACAWPNPARELRATHRRDVIPLLRAVAIAPQRAATPLASPAATGQAALGTSGKATPQCCRTSCAGLKRADQAAHPFPRDPKGLQVLRALHPRRHRPGRRCRRYRRLLHFRQRRLRRGFRLPLHCRHPLQYPLDRHIPR